ncbi:MAG: peptidoglycan DD-metalloendopeptidase family protein [Fibrobacterota bacterium]
MKMILLPACAALLLLSCRVSQKSADQVETKTPPSSIDTSTRTPDTVPTDPSVYFQLRAGEGIFQILGRMNIPHSMKMRIINKLRFNADISVLKSGEQFSAILSADSTKGFSTFRYHPNRVTTHTITYDSTADSLTYSYERLETEKRERLLKGSITAGSSLNESLLSAGLSRNITSVVNGILLCKIAFRTDARVNDTFSVLLQEEFYNDSIIPEFTTVLYTSYNGVRTGEHSAYRYSEEDEKSSYNGHYSRDGQALIHSGVRYPLDRLHISSAYGWRIHPITGRRTMHYGVDYAIRSGAPVYSVAPGKVVLSGYDKYSGNKVAIRHADKSTSWYLHLNKRLVHTGQVVRSRQLIGRVGSTGRSTGPHLHLGFKNARGRWINPNRKRMIATPKLDGARLARLQKQADRTDSIISSIYAEDRIVYIDPVTPESKADSTAQESIQKG